MFATRTNLPNLIPPLIFQRKRKRRGLHGHPGSAGNAAADVSTSSLASILDHPTETVDDDNLDTLSINSLDFTLDAPETKRSKKSM